MAMKYLNGFFGQKGRTFRFKWEWLVVYESRSTGAMGQGVGSWTRHYSGPWPNRARARQDLRDTHRGRYLAGLREYRNIKLQRRLVQADWEDYNDTFRHNAKGNGNGQ